MSGDHHLGALLSAYVDDQLSPTDAERVEAHLAVCADCAAAVQEIREVRGFLAAPPIAVPSETLLTQLSRIEDVHKLGQVESEARKRNWSTRVLIASFGLVACLALLTILGTYDLPDVNSNVAQRAQNSLMQPAFTPELRAISTAQDPGSRLESGLGRLANQSVDFEVLALNRDSDRDEYEAVVTINSAHAVLRERRGKLPAGERALGEVVEVAGFEVQVISDSPWTAVWQREDRVVSVAADAPHDTIALIIESFPPAPVDDGIGARLMRGVHKISQVFG